VQWTKAEAEDERDGVPSPREEPGARGSPRVSPETSEQEQDIRYFLKCVKAFERELHLRFSVAEV
jgi:hypothetical protein